MGATRAYVTIKKPDATMVYINTAELAAAYLKQLQVDDKGHIDQCQAMEDGVKVSDSMQDMVNTTLKDPLDMIKQIHSRLSSLEELLLLAPLPHFKDVDKAINELTNRRDTRDVCRSCQAEPEFEKSPERCINFDLYDISERVEKGSQTEEKVVEKIIEKIVEIPEVPKYKERFQDVECQAKASLICAETAISAPAAELRDEMNKQIAAHQAKYPGGMLPRELRSFEEFMDLKRRILTYAQVQSLSCLFCGQLPR